MSALASPAHNSGSHERTFRLSRPPLVVQGGATIAANEDRCVFEAAAIACSPGFLFLCVVSSQVSSAGSVAEREQRSTRRHSDPPYNFLCCLLMACGIHGGSEGAAVNSAPLSRPGIVVGLIGPVVDRRTMPHSQASVPVTKSATGPEANALVDNLC